MKKETTMSELTQLPNIGPTLADKLAGSGINNSDDLVSVGSIEAALKIRAGVDLGACYNMLYALEGAIRGVRWHDIPKEERRKLKGEFDQAAGY